MKNGNNYNIADLKPISARELQQIKLPQLNVLVEDMLYEGLAILAGPPKSKKSWAALQLAYSVATGQPFLGKKTIKSDCLYLALEDSLNRLQKRLNLMLNGELVPEGLFIDINCNKLDNGLVVQLTNSLKKNPNIKLIIIDTMQLVRGTIGKNETLYGNDYKDLSILKKFADKNHITILLIHHFRKMLDNGDVFNRFSGSTGIIGVADVMFALYKEQRNDKQSILAMSGRDIEEDELIISFDSTTCRWYLDGSREEFDKIKKKRLYDSNPTIITIRKLLSNSETNSIKLTASELYEKIIEITGSRPKENQASGLTKTLNRIQFDMLEYDGIHYEPPPTNGGASGRKMYFCIPKTEDDNKIYTKEQGYI